MRRVYLENLPRRKGKRKEIDWINSAGYKIKFEYHDVVGEFEIIDYDKDSQLLTLLYKNTKHNIKASELRKSSISRIFGYYAKEYKYNIEDTVKTQSGMITIIKLIRIKKGDFTIRGYNFKCSKCEYIGKIAESELLRGRGCPVCSSHKVKIGYNDIWTTNPELAKLLANPDDGYKYSQMSSVKVDWKCTNLQCGEIIKNKTIAKINQRGLSCPRCSDGFSRPNKIGYMFLSQFNIDFKPEYSPSWIKPKRYDFYFELDNDKYVLEMDGSWHSMDNPLSGQTANESVEIDNYKDKKAEEHGIEIIRIDCSNSEFKYIKNSILQSKLSQLFDLSNINWSQLYEFSMSSFVKKACDLWNDGLKSACKIGKELKLGKSTIVKYLTQGKELNWCDYSGKEVKLQQTKNKSVAVVQLNKYTNEKIAEYISIIEAERKTLAKRSNIRLCCQNKVRSAGGYKWMYLFDYIKLQKTNN